MLTDINDMIKLANDTVAFQEKVALTVKQAWLKWPAGSLQRQELEKACNEYKAKVLKMLEEVDADQQKLRAALERGPPAEEDDHQVNANEQPSSNEDEGTSPIVQVTAATPLRKRGRPRKNPADATAPDAVEEKPAPIAKKGHGRPRKHPLPTAPVPSKVNEGPKKPRGRPRKIPRIEDQH